MPCLPTSPPPASPFLLSSPLPPQLLSLCDYVWLGRALPSARSWGCLVVLLGGAVGYVLVDADFRLSAYTWLALWWGRGGGVDRRGRRRRGRVGWGAGLCGEQRRGLGLTRACRLRQS